MKGKTTIKYQPSNRNVTFIEPDQGSANETFSKLIKPSQVSDKELISLGLNSKAANTANKISEEIELFEVVGFGPNCTETEIGDKILLNPGCKILTIKVDGIFYGQVGEFEIEGRFL